MNKVELEKAFDQLSKEYKEVAFREELFRIALGLTKYTISVVDIPKREIHSIHYEDEWEGIEPVMKNVPESILALKILAPGFEDEYKKLFEEIYAGQEAGSHIIKVVKKDGSSDWLCVYYKVLFSKDKKPVKAVCFSENITRKKEAEIVYDQFVNIIEAKTEWSWQINLTTDEIISRKADISYGIEKNPYSSFSDLQENSAIHVVQPFRDIMLKMFDRLNLLQSFYDGERKVCLEYQFKTPTTQEVIWLEGTMYMMLNTDGDVFGILAIKNIDEKKRKEIYLATMAEYDQMCNVMKRNSFIEHVVAEIKFSNPFTLFMMDVDFFKKINDEYGHVFGDEVLKTVAQTIKSCFRSDDLIGRYGGDEFCVAIKGNYSDEVLHSLAKGLVVKVNNIKFANNIHPSLSVGVVKWNNTDTFDQLVSKADQELYKVKATGKNNYSIYMD